MKSLFQRRRQAFIERCLKYLRYVFNDHFVLMMMVLLGFLSLQYRQLLEDFPEQPWLVYALLVLVSLLLLFLGKVATYLEPADTLFLLTKEADVKALVKEARVRAFLLWGSVQVLGQVVLYPIYLKLGWSLPLFIGYLLLLTYGKYAWLQYQSRFVTEQGRFDWDLAIHYEIQRKQVILQFYSLFTRVKGITTGVKRRSYLDFLVSLVKKEHGQTWDYLFVRAFLRSGDFFWLTARLACLSLACLLFIEEAWLATGLAVLFDYLLLFQLLALYHVYDYQYLTVLYPVPIEDKGASFRRVLCGIGYGVAGLQLVVSLVCLADKRYALLLVVASLVLHQFYLPFKSKKLID